MDKKNYILSEVIDFVTNDEGSSNVDKTSCWKSWSQNWLRQWYSDDKNEGLAHHMPRRLLKTPCLTNTVKQNLDESDQTSADESYEGLPKR